MNLAGTKRPADEQIVKGDEEVESSDSSAAGNSSAAPTAVDTVKTELCYVRVIVVIALMVGLCSLNRKGDPRGYFDCGPGTRLIVNRDPLLIGRADDAAVNLVAHEGKYEGFCMGHVATIKTPKTKHLLWGHKISALMDDTKTLLPASLAGYNLRELLRFEGECKDKTTHRPEGSEVYIYISSASDDASLIDAIVEYLRAAHMDVKTL
jgi:hypothetical protein